MCKRVKRKVYGEGKRRMEEKHEIGSRDMECANDECDGEIGER